MKDLDNVAVDQELVRQLADRDYSLLLEQKNGRIYVRVPDLPGCAASGETIGEAIAAIAEAKRSWVDMALALGRKVPEPSVHETAGYSGRILVRTTSSLHRRLVEMARREGVSLNQLISTLLAEAVGAHRAA